jgi:hypothetical protein
MVMKAVNQDLCVKISDENAEKLNGGSIYGNYSFQPYYASFPISPQAYYVGTTAFNNWNYNLLNTYGLSGYNTAFLNSVYSMLGWF